MLLIYPDFLIHVMLTFFQSMSVTYFGRFDGWKEIHHSSSDAQGNTFLCTIYLSVQKKSSVQSWLLERSPTRQNVGTGNDISTVFIFIISLWTDDNAVINKFYTNKPGHRRTAPPLCKCLFCAQNLKTTWSQVLTFEIDLKLYLILNNFSCKHQSTMVNSLHKNGNRYQWM